MENAEYDFQPIRFRSTRLYLITWIPLTVLCYTLVIVDQHYHVPLSLSTYSMRWMTFRCIYTILYTQPGLLHVFVLYVETRSPSYFPPCKNVSGSNGLTDSSTPIPMNMKDFIHRGPTYINGTRSTDHLGIIHQNS